MKFMTVYGYNDTETKVELPDKKITEIKVVILSGDETGTVFFEDGTEIEFDGCQGFRIMDFYDGSYFVTGDENIEKWLNFNQEDKNTLFVSAAYARQEMFK